jgi:hypothetical protein
MGEVGMGEGTMQNVGENGTALRISEERVRQIREQLDFTLKSRLFRGSKRSQDFLRYLVEQALEGCVVIRERSIGIEVFGRKSTYDPADDSVVRVTARDVRNRLSQFNQANKDRPVLIDLPHGSYIPEFLWAEARIPHPEALEPPKRSLGVRKLWKLAVLFGVLLGTAVWIAGWHSPGRSSQIERFWSPLLDTRGAVLICAPTPVTYDFREPVRQRFSAMPSQPSPFQVTPITFPPDGVVYGREIANTTGTFIGEGDARAIANITAMLGRLGKPFELSAGSHAALDDLRRGPSVLIGAFTNEWSGRVARGLPVEFSTAPTYSLRENGGDKRQWIPGKGAQEQELEDYALITRVWVPTTRQHVVLASGFMNYGTQAAGEFLTDPVWMAEAFRDMSSDWSKKNIQIVLHVAIIGKIAGAPRVVAVKVW